jgi:hypothetical protein
LKATQGTGRFGEDALEMFNALEQRVGLRTLRSLLLSAEPRAQIRQPCPQPLEQMIESLQFERQPQRLDRRFDGAAGQQPAQQWPQPRSGDAVAGQHLGQEDRKGPPAAAALAAIGAKDPLPAQGLTLGLGGVVAVKFAVPI